jgi:hypothetical protein
LGPCSFSRLNWAAPHDNFLSAALVRSGLAAGTRYATRQAKADRNSGRVLDVNGALTAAAGLIQYPANNGTTQQWLRWQQ